MKYGVTPRSLWRPLWGQELTSHFGDHPRDRGVDGAHGTTPGDLQESQGHSGVTMDTIWTL